MGAHLFGYFDNIIIVIGIFSVLLLIKGKPWPGACLQILALLIHENSMLLVFPPFCLALFLMNTRNNKSGIHVTSFLPLLLLVVAFIVLMVAHEMFLAENFVESFTKYLSRFPFIQDDRSTYAPEWISKSFLDYYESESGGFFQRITSAAMYRLVLPSALAILYFIVRVYRIRFFSAESFILLGVCFVPQMMHLVAWDTSRIWTYTIFCAFFVLWIYSEIIPGHKDSSVSRFLCLGALVANVVILTPLMDKQIDHFSLMTRLFLYTPVILISLGLILYKEYIDRRKGF
jgi:hypothetical protein